MKNTSPIECDKIYPACGTSYRAGSTEGEKQIWDLIGKRIVLGVSGGIAAYKTARAGPAGSRDRGAEVAWWMTDLRSFYHPHLALQPFFPVSGIGCLLDSAAEAAMAISNWGNGPDWLILAPATPILRTRTAGQWLTTFVTTICLATAAPVAIVPAMNQQMYRALPTQHNIQQLDSVV